MPIAMLFACDLAKPAPIGQYIKEETEEFSSNEIHVEVMTNDGFTQVFYFINSNELANGISLKPLAEHRGEASGFESFIAKDQENNLSNGAFFSDIIAIPQANKNNYLSPRIPNIRTKLSMEQSFKLDLINDQAYTIILNPNGLYDRAPLFAHLKPQSRETIKFSDSNNPIVRGRLGHKNAPLAFGKNKLPKLRARVLLGNRLISSSGILDDDGKFALELSAEKSLSFKGLTMYLAVDPVDSESGFLHIRKGLKPKEIYRNPEMGIIDAGPINSPFSLSINVRDTEQKPVPNAEVILRAKKNGMEILAKKTLSSSGFVVFNELYEANYEIAVVPPLASPFGIHFQNNIYLSKEKHEPLTINLAKRRPLMAVILDEQMNQVEGALLEFSRIGEKGSLVSEDIFKDLLFKQSAISDESGKLCQGRKGLFGVMGQSCEAPFLDQGRYLVHISPKSPSSLSQTYATFDFPDDRTLLFNLAKPKKLRGKIVSEDQRVPVAKAFITIYWADHSNLYNQPKPIGNTLSDELGNFEVFVPGP